MSASTMRELVVALLLGTSLLPPAAPADLAVRDVRVVRGDGLVLPVATILVRSGRIVAIDVTSERNRQPARRSVDGRGLTALPGLIDAHVHVRDWAMPLFLRWGVTTVRDLHNDPTTIFALARDESPMSPRIVPAGALIDGPGSFRRDAIEVSTVGEARAAVRRQIARGAGVIKVYTRLPPSLLQVVVNEASARGVPVAAHIGRSTAIDAARTGVASLEHLSGISDAASDAPDRMMRAHEDFLWGWTTFAREWLAVAPENLERVGRTLREAGVTLVPTLALHEALSRLADPELLRDPARRDVPREVIEREWDPDDIMGRAGWTAETLRAFAAALPVMQRVVARFAAEGGRVVAGTDTPQTLVVPGASLHRELQLYVEAGLSPAAALRAATAHAADLLGLSHQVGTIAAGKDADLLLVEGDPLTDIRHTTRIRVVIRRGTIVHER
jgi:imidazolonepropionase-like amidohydrolase